LRFDKAWTIVRKEFAEYRRNKYILYSLFLMPIIMSVVLPAVYLAPASSIGGQTQSTPYDLGLSIVNHVDGVHLNNLSFNNVAFNNCRLSDCVAVRCTFNNTTVVNSFIRNSEFNSSTALDSAVWHSNIRSSDMIGGGTGDSIFVGQETGATQYIVIIVNLILMFFVLIPAILPTVIASYSFVGEKLNRSLEPLLATPTTDLELLVGKTLAIFVPSMLVTWISVVPAIVIVDVITQPILGYLLLPSALWIVGVFLVAPLVCVLSVLFNVIVSARVSDVRTSQQIGSVIVLPIVAFFIVGLAGLLIISITNMLLFAGALVLIDAIVMFLALRTFQREKILLRWK